MITSPLLYERDIPTIQSTYPDRIRHELNFMLNSTFCHLNSKQAPVLAYLTKLDPKFEEHLHQASVIKVVETEHRTPNTEITLSLGDRHTIRGDFTVRYNRASVEEYFNITKLINDNITDPALTIDYREWLALQDNQQDFLNHISRILTYKLGNTFGRNGVVLQDSGENQGKPYQGQHGLALIIPSRQDIEEGWKHMENIVNEEKGTLTYQILTVTLRLVAKNHLTIRDSEALIHIRLRQPLQGYVEMTGGKA